MTSRSDTKAAKIREIMKNTPGIKAKQVAEMTGCTPQQVYGLIYSDKRRAAAKKQAKKALRARAKLPNSLKPPIRTYGKELVGFDARSDIIADLRHQIVGFRAVISYLENQLGLKNSQ